MIEKYSVFNVVVSLASLFSGSLLLTRAYISWFAKRCVSHPRLACPWFHNTTRGELCVFVLFFSVSFSGPRYSSELIKWVCVTNQTELQVNNILTFITIP